MQRLDLKRRLAAITSSTLARGAIVLSILTFARLRDGPRPRPDLRPDVRRRRRSSTPTTRRSSCPSSPSTSSSPAASSRRSCRSSPACAPRRPRRPARSAGSILTLAVGVMGILRSPLRVRAADGRPHRPGLRAPSAGMYVDLFRIMCFTPVIFAASIVLGEILVAERRFLAYGLAPLFYNGGIVVGTVLLASGSGSSARPSGRSWRAGCTSRSGWSVSARTVPAGPDAPPAGPRGRATSSVLMAPKMLSHPVEPLTFLYFTSLASRFDAGSVSSVSFARNFAERAGQPDRRLVRDRRLPGPVGGRRDRRPRGVRPGLRDQPPARSRVLTTAAAVGLFIVGRAGRSGYSSAAARSSEADIARTTSVLAVFALAVPFESLSHLLARAMYATHNTIMPTIASVAGFVVTVVAARRCRRRRPRGDPGQLRARDGPQGRDPRRSRSYPGSPASARPGRRPRRPRHGGAGGPVARGRRPAVDPRAGASGPSPVRPGAGRRCVDRAGGRNRLCREPVAAGATLASRPGGHAVGPGAAIGASARRSAAAERREPRAARLRPRRPASGGPRPRGPPARRPRPGPF